MFKNTKKSSNLRTFLRTGSRQRTAVGCHTLQNNTTMYLITLCWPDWQIGLARAGSPIPGAKQYWVHLLCPHTATAHRITCV